MTKSLRRIIWEMSDEDAKTLLELSREHTKLALEYIKPITPLDHKEAIRAEINALLDQRDAIINKYK